MNALLIMFVGWILLMIIHAHMATAGLGWASIGVDLGFWTFNLIVMKFLKEEKSDGKG